MNQQGIDAAEKLVHLLKETNEKLTCVLYSLLKAQGGAAPLSPEVTTSKRS